MKIRTNRNWRPFKYRDEVPSKVLADQFDWTNEAHEEHGDYSDGFIEYRGCWYHLGDFMRSPDAGSLGAWSGYHGDSFFSGVVINLSDDGETYQIGTYIS